MSKNLLRSIAESLKKDNFADELCGGAESIMKNEKSEEYYRLFR